MDVFLSTFLQLLYNISVINGQVKGGTFGTAVVVSDLKCKMSPFGIADVQFIIIVMCLKV